MRGYVTFILVLIALLLVFSLAELNSEAASSDFSKAIIVERVYSLQMNIKECMVEALRQGAQNGFDDYDSSHGIAYCKHCPDASCSLLPLAPNKCDRSLCEKCFRESEARAQAEQYAYLRVALVIIHDFDSDFVVSIETPQINAFTIPNSFSNNGYSLDSVRFADDVQIHIVSEKFVISADAKILKGVLIKYESSSNN